MDKTALFKLRLMDSVLKESARVNSFPTQMRRIAEKDLKLSDGTVIPRGTYTMIAPVPMLDPHLYGPAPEQFDGHRFMRMRDRAQGQVAQGANDTNIDRYQYVSTSSEDLTFGHGRHACPGRFFASYEIKILLAYLLLHFDFKPATQTASEMKKHGFEQTVDHGQKLLYKARDSEVEWHCKV